ncbi:MAG: winged helix-turn-helix transcriptional regulator [Candidatus Aureabacteria bacterium]|nr:winged helix-turn-helix transcriptional regulator [Candidatus Auribacterota bacterium]
MDKDHKIAEINKVLSVNTRVKIIRLLSEKAFCVGALSARLGITPGAVSQHMRILKSAGLVVPEKKGYYVHYRLEKQALRNWAQEINELSKI